ncbi:MAG: dihydrofolate reductase [Candidatus Nanohaloarchaea archaeon]|nr:dihydrofolate reductase [Candidatus Nanohaloarchaea archaeon]
MEKVIIAAMTEDRVIGKDGKIPWHYPEDLKHFRKKTRGFPVIAGKTTYQSIVEKLGEPLPERKNIVLSFEPMEVPEKVVNANSIEEALQAAEDTGKEKVFVIGGGSVYRQFLEKADRMVITFVDTEVDGDTYFPEWDDENWREVSRESSGDLEFVELLKDA